MITGTAFAIILVGAGLGISVIIPSYGLSLYKQWQKDKLELEELKLKNNILKEEYFNKIMNKDG